MEEIKIRDEFIKLGQLLKLADMVQDGVEAKYVITDGLPAYTLYTAFFCLRFSYQPCKAASQDH